MRLKKRLTTLSVLMGAMLVAPNTFAATAEDIQSRAKEFFSKSEIHAFAEGGYIFNTTSDKANPIGVLQKDDNDFSANGEIVFENGVEELWDVGFRTDLHFGTDIADAIASSGSDSSDDFEFEQLYLEAIVPFFDKEVKLTLGKFITHIGWELIPGYDAVNDNISRSITFGFGIPFTHTGLKATYTISENAEFSLMGVNGWDNIDDNNDGKSIGAQLIWSPCDKLTVYANGIGGPEQDDEDSEWRYVANLILEYAASDKLTVVLNGIYGHEEDVDSTVTTAAIVPVTVGGVTVPTIGTTSVTTESNADWGSIVGYIRYQINDKWACITRAEGFWDNDGARTGVDQDLFEITKTIEYAINDDARVRLEGRYDHSNEDFFDGGKDDDQFIVALNAQLRF